MQKLALAVLFFFSTISYAGNVSPSDAKEREAVKNAVYEYYVGALINNGDIAKIEEGFLPEFTLFGLKNENKELWTLPIAKWKQKQIEGKAKGKLPRTADKKYRAEVVSIDLIGTLAVVKIDLYEGDRYAYVDVLSLYKINGKWKLVSKVYYRVPDAKK